MDNLSSEQLYRLAQKKEKEELLPKIEIQLTILNEMLVPAQRLVKNKIDNGGYGRPKEEGLYYHIKNLIEDLERLEERIIKDCGE